MDGRFIGYVDDGERLAKAFRKLRREGQINPSASVLLLRADEQEGLLAALHQPERGQGHAAAHRRRERQAPPHPGDDRRRSPPDELTWRDLVERGIVELHRRQRGGELPRRDVARGGHHASTPTSSSTREPCSGSPHRSSPILSTTSRRGTPTSPRWRSRASASPPPRSRSRHS